MKFETHVSNSSEKFSNSCLLVGRIKLRNKSQFPTFNISAIFKDNLYFSYSLSLKKQCRYKNESLEM